MNFLRRPQILIPLVIVVLVGGFVFLNSRGGGGKDKVNLTDAPSNCPPIARADAAATKPDEPIAIDVLANDTDVDGDPLVFQILKTEGGTSTIDDGGTPTDASDDRLLFTPATPAPPTATIEYEALDPSGGFSSSTVSVTVNDSATLPDGVRSAFATDPAPEGSQSSKCSSDTPTTEGPLIAQGPDSVTTTTATTLLTTNTTARSGHTTTTVKKSSSKNTTTTAKKSTTTTAHSNTTQTTQKPTTTTQKPTTTTTKPNTTSTTKPPPNCGSPVQNDPNYNPNYAQCVNDYYHQP